MVHHKTLLQQIRDFFEVGYFLVDKLFSADEVHSIGAAFDRLRERAAGLRETTIVNGTQFVVENDSIHRIVWCCGIEPELARFGEDPRITVPVAKILDSPQFYQLICQAHLKLPGDGVHFPWHQDTENRGYGTGEWTDVNGRGSYVQTLTAIDEVTADNSPLLVLPYSCKRGHLYLDRGNNRERLVDEAALVPVIMHPGSTLFFNPYLIHGSRENRSSRPRRVFINGYCYPGANRKIYPGAGVGKLVSLPLPA